MKELIQLIKLRVVLLSTLSAVTGFVLSAGGFSSRWGGLVVFIGALFCLAAGSAALNQYQEREPDRLMERTKNRPLPGGRLSPMTGLLISLLLITGGLLLLFFIFGALPALLGLVTVVMYNGVYTYLKKVTAFASIPGAIVGALPPAIGWTAAGGIITSPTLVGLMLFFYLWQIPHFWILMNLHAGDYVKAGFPCLCTTFTGHQLSRLTFSWILSTACAALLFPLFNMFNHSLSFIVLIGITLWLGLGSLPLLKSRLSAEPVFRRTFVNINIFALLIMVIIIIDHGVSV